MSHSYYLTQAILDKVHTERFAQDKKWGERNHPDGTGDWWNGFRDTARKICENKAEAGQLTWLDILREEVFEAFAESDPEKLETELVQVAAVAVAWLEAIRRRS